MTTALLGYTGFVGSNLLASRSFDDRYNSQNISELAGRSYDLVVSSANRADSHRINQHGEADRAEIDQLISTIEKAEIKKLVLISTVCVYPGGSSPDEDTPLSPADLTPYGANRLHQERRLAETFDTLIVRLPQLYGANVKKGVVHDLANDYRVEFIRPAGVFQHYGVDRLWNDIRRALDLGLPAINIATPPLSNDVLAREVFGTDISGQTPEGAESPFAQMYTRDMRTLHADAFGGTGDYLMTSEEELDGLRRFVDRPSPPPREGV